MKQIIIEITLGGYNIMEEKIIDEPFKNIIDDKKVKVKIGDTILSYLINQNLIDIENDLNHLVVEFGYLFQDNDNNIVTLIKVETANKLKTFFVACQENKLILLTDEFNEALFRKTANDMLKMHKVDMTNLNRKDYFMELSSK